MSTKARPFSLELLQLTSARAHTKASASYAHWWFARANLDQEADEEPDEEKDASDGTGNGDSVGEAIELALESGVFRLVAEGFMRSR